MRKEHSIHADKVAELAALHQLGKPGPRFTNSVKRLRPILIRSIVFISMSPASIVLCFLYIGLLYLFFREERYLAYGMYVFLATFDAGMLTFAIALKFDLPRYRRLKKEQIAFFEHGFVYFDVQKKRFFATRWEQIERLGDVSRQIGKQWLSGVAVTTNLLGEEYFSVIPDLPDRAEICKRIKEAYISERLPQFLQEYEQGKKFDFYIMEISQESIKKFWYYMDQYGDYWEVEKEELLFWDEIVSIEIEDDSIVIKSKKQPDMEEGKNWNLVWSKRELSMGSDMALCKALLSHVFLQLGTDS